MPMTLDGTTGASLIQSTAAPFLVGQVCFFAMNSAPSGFLKCNGAAVSRTTYSQLFAAIGTTYGSGDGSTTFNLPEMRGEFVRSLDDGRGIDSSRGIGSAQGDAMRNITGNLFMQGNRQSISGADGVFAGSGSGQYADVGGGGSLPTTVDFNASRQVPTAAEFRPRNVALLACIKF